MCAALESVLRKFMQAQRGYFDENNVNKIRGTI